MRVWLQIQGSRVRSLSGPILSWRLIMKWFLRSYSSLPLIHSRRVVVSYKRKYVHELLVNRLFKPAQEKSVARWTVRLAMTIAVDLGRKATKPTNQPNTDIKKNKVFSFSNKLKKNVKLTLCDTTLRHSKWCRIKFWWHHFFANNVTPNFWWRHIV